MVYAFDATLLALELSIHVLILPFEMAQLALVSIAAGRISDYSVIIAATARASLDVICGFEITLK